MRPPRAGLGRPKGAKNKRQQTIEERIAATGCDPAAILAQVANNQLECAHCRGKGKTKWQPGNSDHPGIRDCQSCWGSGKESINPKDRAWAAAELMCYLAAKKKAVEVTGAGGGPLQHGITVRFVDPTSELAEMTSPSSHAND